MEAVQPTPKEFSFLKALGETWSIYTQHLLLFLAAGIMTSATAMLANFINFWDLNSPLVHILLPLGILLSIINYFLNLGISITILKFIREKTFTLKDIFWGFKNLPNILTSIILLLVLSMVSFILLIIPGIIFICATMFSVWLLFDHKDRGLSFISLNWNFTMNHKTDIFLAGLFWFILSLPFVLINSQVITLAPELKSLLTLVANIIQFITLVPLATIFWISVYEQIRMISGQDVAPPPVP